MRDGVNHHWRSRGSTEESGEKGGSLVRAEGLP